MKNTTNAAQLYGFATAVAPGRISLVTEVGEQFDDGYHEVSAVSLAVSMSDHVKVSPRADSAIVVEFSENSRGINSSDTVPEQTAAVVFEAAETLRERFHLEAEEHGVDIEITKNLPLSGGVGSRAADAAATLLACACLWELSLTRKQLADIGATISTQVPFALTGGTVVASGRGDVLSPMLGRAHLDFVVVPAAKNVSAEEVYALHRKLIDENIVEARENPSVSAQFLTALTNDDVYQVALGMHNDLQTAVIALMPELGDILDAGMAEGALAGMVCGTGPTIVLLTNGPEESQRIALALESTTDVACIPVSAPVDGAKLI